MVGDNAVTHTEPPALALPPIPGGWTDETITLAGRAIRLTRPADPDAFLDDPATLSRHRETGYMPYWPYLWPAARKMASAVAAADWPPGTDVLEIGAGLGLVGLAALARGCNVTFSDYCPQAVQIARHNARRNGFGRAEAIVVDWRAPLPRRFPVILGCDVIYETANHGPVLGLLDTMLAGDGVCWLGDAGRHQAEAFVRLARDRGFTVGLRDETGRRLERPLAGGFQIVTLERREPI